MSTVIEASIRQPSSQQILLAVVVVTIVGESYSSLYLKIALVRLVERVKTLSKAMGLKSYWSLTELSGNLAKVVDA